MRPPSRSVCERLGELAHLGKAQEDSAAGCRRIGVISQTADLFIGCARCVDWILVSSRPVFLDYPRARADRIAAPRDKQRISRLRIPQVAQNGLSFGGNRTELISPDLDRRRFSSGIEPLQLHGRQPKASSAAWRCCLPRCKLRVSLSGHHSQARGLPLAGLTVEPEMPGPLLSSRARGFRARRCHAHGVAAAGDRSTMRPPQRRHGRQSFGRATCMLFWASTSR